MTNHSNRGRIKCAPLVRWRHGLLMGMPKSLEPLAFTYVNFPQVPDGILVRVVATGMLCKWVGGHLESVDQRKATAALNRMLKEQKDGQNDIGDDKPAASRSR